MAEPNTEYPFSTIYADNDASVSSVIVPTAISAVHGAVAPSFSVDPTLAERLLQAKQAASLAANEDDVREEVRDEQAEGNKRDDDKRAQQNDDTVQANNDNGGDNTLGIAAVLHESEESLHQLGRYVDHVLHNVGHATHDLSVSAYQELIKEAQLATSPIAMIAEAIGHIESRGRYGIIGPRTRDGDHAYGKYQVMGKYVGAWTEQVLGHRLTPEQFLNDPKAQDAVAYAKMGADYKHYGNVEDVAAKWFSGRPIYHNDSHDITGVSVPKYAGLARERFDALVAARKAMTLTANDDFSIANDHHPRPALSRSSAHPEPGLGTGRA